MCIFKIFRKKKADELSIPDKKDNKRTESRASDSGRMISVYFPQSQKAKAATAATVNSPDDFSRKLHIQNKGCTTTYYFLQNQREGNRAVSGSMLWLNENRRSITVKSIPGEFDFSSDEYIFYWHILDNQYLALATFGNKKNANEMMMFLDSFGGAFNIILMNVKRVYEGTPEFIEPEKREWATGFFIDVKKNGNGDPLIVDDFEIYIDDNRIVFLFGTEEELVKNNAQYTFSGKCESERLLFGYDGLRLTCIIIRDLTEIELEQVIDKIKRRKIPLEKKIPNKHFCDEYEYFIWQKKDKQKQASIVNYTGKADKLILPSELGDIAVVEIRKHVFAGNTRLESIVLPDGMVNIAAFTFCGCENLTDISLPECVTSIEEGTFSGCGNLTKIKLPDGVTSIGKEAFKECESLTSIALPENLTSIGESAFEGCGLKSIRIPEKVKRIERYAFSSCSDLAEIVFPDGLTAIEEYAFSDCWCLENIVVPVSVEMIGDSAFDSCYYLSNIYYQGSEDDWNQIEICDNALPSGVIVHCVLD